MDEMESLLEEAIERYSRYAYAEQSIKGKTDRIAFEMSMRGGDLTCRLLTFYGKNIKLEIEKKLSSG